MLAISLKELYNILHNLCPTFPVVVVYPNQNAVSGVMKFHYYKKSSVWVLLPEAMLEIPSVSFQRGNLIVLMQDDRYIIDRKLLLQYGG